jgi:antitoxin (DNA-binding transcriptional repressor) of toxin-antitoxin stability system
MLRYMTLRDLRNTPGALWRKLRGGVAVAVTSQGQPRALIIGLEADELPETIRLLERLRAQLAVSRLRQAATASGAAALDSAAIDAEIEGARSGRRSR